MVHWARGLFALHACPLSPGRTLLLAFSFARQGAAESSDHVPSRLHVSGQRVPGPPLADLLFVMRRPARLLARPQQDRRARCERLRYELRMTWYAGGLARVARRRASPRLAVSDRNVVEGMGCARLQSSQVPQFCWAFLPQPRSMQREVMPNQEYAMSPSRSWLPLIPPCSSRLPLP